MGLVPLLPPREASSRKDLPMWNWICCYVTGHDYSVSCNEGAMFLRCVTCGHRSQGWVVHAASGHTHGQSA